MELRHLRYFVTVAEELNLTRAAERLHMAQPPLSAQIRDLETELGVSLFFRERNRIRLTPAGEAFLVEARATLAQSERAASTARRVADGELGVLRIAFASGSLARDALPRALKAFKARQREVTVELREAPPFDQVRSLERADIDIAIAEFSNADLESGFAAHRSFGITPLVRTRLAVAVSTESELARMPVINLRQIADQPLITSPRTGAFERWRLMLDDLYLRAGRRPAVVQEVTDKATMLSLVAVGLGVAIVPDHLIGLRIPDVAFVPLEDVSEEGSVVALWRRAEGSLLCRQFLDILSEVVKSGREDWAHLVTGEGPA